MCLIGIALNIHPDYPFVLVSNRDEFEVRGHFFCLFFHSQREGGGVQNRASTSPNVGEDGVLCGRDLRSHGTWIGLHTGTGIPHHPPLARSTEPHGLLFVQATLQV